MWRMLSAALVVVAISTVAACASRLPLTAGSPQEFTGYLVAEIGQDVFLPCDAEPDDTRWRAQFYGPGLTHRQQFEYSGVLQLPRPLFVRVHALLSDRHHPGSSRGRTTRTISVQDVISTAISGGCAHPDVAYASAAQQ